MIDHLGNLEPFGPQGAALGELAEFGMAHCEPGTGAYGGQDGMPKALMALRLLDGRRGLPKVVDRQPIRALGLVSGAEVVVRSRSQDAIAAGRGERQGTL